MLWLHYFSTLEDMVGGGTRHTIYRELVQSKKQLEDSSQQVSHFFA